MPTTQASPAVGATPRYAGALRRGGGTSHQTQSQEGKGKTDALTLLSKRIFGAVKVKPFGRASATLTEIEYPLLVKRVFNHPPPRHRGCAAKPPTATAADASRLCRPRRRRRPSGLRARYAGALRRGGEGLTKRSLKRVRGKTVPLPSYHKRIFGVLSRSSPSGAQARP